MAPGHSSLICECTLRKDIPREGGQAKEQMVSACWTFEPVACRAPYIHVDLYEVMSCSHPGSYCIAVFRIWRDETCQGHDACLCLQEQALEHLHNVELQLDCFSIHCICRSKRMTQDWTSPLDTTAEVWRIRSSQYAEPPLRSYVGTVPLLL